MKIIVDPNDGVPNDSTLCAVAMGIAYAFITIDSEASHTINVHEEGALEGRVKIDGKIYDLPAFVVDFINAFDEGRPVQPFEFDLDILQ